MWRLQRKLPIYEHLSVINILDFEFLNKNISDDSVEFFCSQYILSRQPYRLKDKTLNCGLFLLDTVVGNRLVAC